MGFLRQADTTKGGEDPRVVCGSSQAVETTRAPGATRRSSPAPGKRGGEARLRYTERKEERRTMVWATFGRRFGVDTILKALDKREHDVGTNDTARAKKKENGEGGELDMMNSLCHGLSLAPSILADSLASFLRAARLDSVDGSGKTTLTLCTLVRPVERWHQRSTCAAAAKAVTRGSGSSACVL